MVTGGDDLGFAAVCGAVCAGGPGPVDVDNGEWAVSRGPVANLDSGL
jgi:hypothetical protein